MTTPLSDINNLQMDVVEGDGKYDVATGYALLANAPLPPVVRADDLEE